MAVVVDVELGLRKLSDGPVQHQLFVQELTPFLLLEFDAYFLINPGP